MISDFMKKYQLRRAKMKVSKEINDLVNAYCRLRDRQHAVYSKCAKRHDLTTNELFVLDILWFSPDGCTQTEICERLSSNKQTIAAIITRFWKKGYVVYEEVMEDRRNKRIRFTEAGREYAGKVIPPAAEAENLAMAELGLENLTELVDLTMRLTENMEKQFSSIEGNS